ncbi:EamA family transporter [Ectothiorhodospiraceae bacterium WFHF3C12]|nr:EamA family transporter [Ectothiorhodospiraceae bacterium WFHF3C12]
MADGEAATGASASSGASGPAVRPLAGVALMALGVSTLPLMDGLAKYLSSEYHVVQVTWARYLFHLLLLSLLLAGRLRPAELIPRQWGLQLLRSALLLGTTLCYFGAVSYLPLADVLALAFISPVVSTALAPLVLGEHVGGRRWVAVALGFAGALVVIRPGLGVFHWASVLGLGAGFFYGSYQLATRRLSGSGRPVITPLYTAVFGVVVLSVMVPAFWTMPDAAGWVLMAAMGGFGALAHFLIIRAFEHAAAPVLAPVNYVEIVAATALGWVAFGDFPDPWTWSGIALIIGSGCFIALAERR